MHHGSKQTHSRLYVEGLSKPLSDHCSWLAINVSVYRILGAFVIEWIGAFESKVEKS